MRQAVWMLPLLGLLQACSGSSSNGTFADEPPLEKDEATLAAALDCSAFEHPDKPPVLLVHGTFTTGYEQYDWTYRPLLEAEGYDVCTVTYPDRGLGDSQESAEYVVYALREIYAETGRKVAVIGHSQGVSVPRWAIKWWPSAREAVEDFIMQAGPNHGLELASISSVITGLTGGLLGLPEVFYQFAADSNFNQALNADDETPGDIDYTAVYSLFDELIQPVIPEPSAAVDYGLDNPHVANILLQDICPGLLADHVTIGLLDAVTYALMLDAIENDGPADVERAGGSDLCGALPIVPDLVVAPVPALLVGIVNVLLAEPQNGIPSLHLSNEEPPLKDYAQ